MFTHSLNSPRLFDTLTRYTFLFKLLVFWGKSDGKKGRGRIWKALRGMEYDIVLYVLQY